jgi:hypothetical protein
MRQGGHGALGGAVEAGEVESRRVKLTNEAFFRQHAAMGRVGMVGGTSGIDKGIRFAQRHLIADGRHSSWSHVFVFEGERVDGRLWILESDVDIRFGRQLRVGVQENRIEKYVDEKAYPNVAVLDFGLGPEEARKLIGAGLEFVSRGTRYAVGGIFKTYWAILSKQLHKEREKDSTFCSSFIRTLFRAVEIDIAPGVAVRHTSPEHVSQTPARHRRYELIRD